MEGKEQDSTGVSDEAGGKIRPVRTAGSAESESANRPLSLRQFLQVLATALEGLPERVAYLDPELKIRWANRTAAESVNLPPEALVGRYCHEVWHQRSDVCVDCPVHKALHSGVFQEGEITGADGKVWLVRGEPVRNANGDIIGFVELARDITQQRNAEDRLRESEMKYSTLVEKGNDWVIVVQDGVIKFANAAVVQTTGFSMQEVLGRPFLSYIAPEWRASVALSHMKRLAGEEVPNRYETELLRKDGTRIPVDINANVIMYEGKPAAMAVVRDITERKRFEAELVRLKKAVDGSGEAVFLTGCDGVITSVNPAFTNLYGYAADEVIGKTTPRILKSGKISVADYDAFWKAILAGQVVRREFINKTKDGRLVTVESSASPVLDDRGKMVGFLAIHTDVTERKQMQEKLILSDRLAAIGEMAAGVTHELNNPLASVIGFADLLCRRQDLPEGAREDLDIISREATRAGQVVRNLLTFARRHEPQKTLTDIHSIIQNVLELRAYEQKLSNIEVKTSFASDLPDISVDAFRLQQVFLNIIINSEYFMTEAHGRGTLTITTQRVAGAVRISFADDGPGIAPENVSRIFDPFFTTKPVGKGTGLGLSICHGIVTSHGGRIYARSEPGTGATFVVELPIS